jgi:hypothetical protein
LRQNPVHMLHTHGQCVLGCTAGSCRCCLARRLRPGCTQAVLPACWGLRLGTQQGWGTCSGRNHTEWQVFSSSRVVTVWPFVLAVGMQQGLGTCSVRPHLEWQTLKRLA